MRRTAFIATLLATMAMAPTEASAFTCADSAGGVREGAARLAQRYARAYRVEVTAIPTTCRQTHPIGFEWGMKVTVFRKVSLGRKVRVGASNGFRVEVGLTDERPVVIVRNPNGSIIQFSGPGSVPQRIHPR